jgi:RNA polymerase sigma-70 factor (sigma-E family)
MKTWPSRLSKRAVRGVFYTRTIRAAGLPSYPEIGRDMTDSAPGVDPRRGGIGVQAGAPGVGLLRKQHRPVPADVVADLYLAHVLALVRTAMMLVGDKPTAEDVVQDAFIGLYRAVPRLSSNDKALAYLRASVVNGCRSVHRARQRAFARPVQHAPTVWSAESAAMAREESRLTMQAVSRLPARAREVLALRYYLDLPDAEIAAALGISRGSVSSTASRALAVLARELKGEL